MSDLETLNKNSLFTSGTFGTVTATAFLALTATADLIGVDEKQYLYEPVTYRSFIASESTSVATNITAISSASKARSQFNDTVISALELLVNNQTTLSAEAQRILDEEIWDLYA